MRPVIFSIGLKAARLAAAYGNVALSKLPQPMSDAKRDKTRAKKKRTKTHKRQGRQ